MHLDNWKSPLHLQAGWHLWPRQQEDTGLAQGEPYGGLGEGGLSSLLSWLQAFWLFCVGRLWFIGHCKVSQQIQWSDPEHEGGDGVPRQGHPGEGLHELQVQDRGCLYSWRQFYWICWLSLLIFFYFNKIGWFSAVLFPFKRKKKKIPDLSLPPCIFIVVCALLLWRQ